MDSSQVIPVDCPVRWSVHDPKSIIEVHEPGGFQPRHVGSLRLGNRFRLAAGGQEYIVIESPDGSPFGAAGTLTAKPVRAVTNESDVPLIVAADPVTAA